MERKQRPFSERLWSFIQKGNPDECWPWTGGTAGKGYGTLRKKVEGKWKQAYAHREVLRLTVGEPSFPKAHALHSCDNPICCNPAHLAWGTNSKNRREARDRLHNQGNQKLTPDQVEMIRAMSGAYPSIAAKFGVHFDTVAKIKRNVSWKP